jgi:hypothetical protein
MVKFSREYEASIIPEWKGAFVDYKCLKKLIKKIKVARRDEDDSTTAPSDADALVAGAAGGFSVLDPVRALASRFAPRVQAPSVRSSCLAHALLSFIATCTAGADVCLSMIDVHFGRRTRRTRIPPASSCDPRPSM